MKIAVLGNGYLGSSFKQKGITVLGKEDFSINYGYEYQNDYFKESFKSYDVIINCIAKSNTRFCEENFGSAFFSNSIIPDILSNWCALNEKKYVHISTGCLYDKNNIPQKETDTLAAHCNYTLTKWIGEKNCNPETDLIIRPRLFFDNSDRPNNLLNKIRRFDKLCRELDSVSSIDVVVDATLALIMNKATGVFNVACDGYISMWEIGKLMGFEKDWISIEEVRKQQGLHLVNNTLDLSKLKQYFTPPNIECEILRCLSK
jgi:dTDP-4-dehydrorhamnose reductase